jgi:hypothetical protein
MMRTSLVVGPMIVAAMCFAACENDSVVFDENANSTATTSSANGGAGGSGGSGGATSNGGNSSGTGGTTSNGNGGGEPTCRDLGDPCTQCEVQNCNDSYCACYGDQQCGDLFLCLSMCGLDDQNCWQACYTNNPGGISKAALISSCAATECTVECPGAIALDPCEICLYDKCDTAMNACIANPACLELLVCLDTCNSPGCENQCYSLYPNGLADAGAVGNCLQASCATECG